MFDFSKETLVSLKDKIAAGEVSASEVIEAVGASIETLNPTIGGYLSYDVAKALAESSTVDSSLPLSGLPIAIKDNINVKGETCTCSSKFLSEGYQSPYSATVINNLRSQGGVPLGRLNMDEFAMGSATETSALMKTVNPKAHDRIPGGSSGGSAAVVGGDLALAALGSDTGGSIRQPASHCGIVGMKPSYGRVSRYGLVAFSSSLDQIGPLTKTVDDAALLMNSLVGYDAKDSTSTQFETPDFTEGLTGDVKGLKIGIPAEFFSEGLDPRVKAVVEKKVKALEEAGAEIVEISLPHAKYAVAVYYIVAPAEASSNLSRFDGVRYGRRAESPEDVMDMYVRSRSEGFGPEVKRRIILGTFVLSSGYADAFYKKAQKVRTLIKQDFDKAFEQVDAIVTPVTPEPARKIGENSDDPIKEYLADIYTIPANMAGIPAISVPGGEVEEEGVQLPVGVQVMTAYGKDHEALKVAKAIESLG